MKIIPPLPSRQSISPESEQSEITIPTFLQVCPLDDGDGGWLLSDQGGFFLEHEQALALLSEVARGYMRAQPDWIAVRNREADEEWSRHYDNATREGRRRHSVQIGYVYLLTADGRYKIGVSRRLLERQAQLNKQSPVPVTAVHHVYVADYRELERELHKRYDDSRLHGEWFDFDAETVASVVDDMDAWATAHPVDEAQTGGVS